MVYVYKDELKLAECFYRSVQNISSSRFVSKKHEVKIYGIITLFFCEGVKLGL
jgi:hypothetical protein